MASLSYPSRIITLVDVPEVENFTAKFEYNFFTKDETTNDTNVRESTINSENELNNLLGRLPRFVKFEFTPPSLQKCSPDGTGLRSPRQETPLGDPASLLTSENIPLIQSEESFSNLDFISIDFQDNGIDGKLYQAVSGSAFLRGITTQNQIDSAKTLNTLTSNKISGNFLLDSLNKPSSTGITFVDSKTGIEKSGRPSLGGLEKIAFKAQINNKVVGTIVKSVVDDKLNLYVDEFESILGTAQSLQDLARAKSSPSLIEAVELDSGFIPIKTESGNPLAFGHEARFTQVVGYIIDKQEFVDGKLVDKEAIIIIGATPVAAIDTRVRYGATYNYSIRTIVAVKLPSINTAGDYILATGLIQSKSSAQVTVECTENVAPPPPADFKLDWDYSEQKLRLMWSFPVNTQRDVKYFQIFRRTSLFSPFVLQAEFDFNDSDTLPIRDESIPSELVEEMIDNPRTFYVDEEFTKDSVAIYAVCCVDARGLSSNYSMQFGATFNRFSNKLEPILISSAGAPKVFPNMFLRQNVFIDTMKTSGFDRMKVYFDPEYLELFDEEGEDLGFIDGNDPNASYKIQLINTDLQKSQIATIKINDLRT